MTASASNSEYKGRIAALQRAAQVQSGRVLGWLALFSVLFIASLAAASVWLDLKTRQVTAERELGRVQVRAATLAGLAERGLEDSKVLLLSIERRSSFRSAWARRDLPTLHRHLRDILQLDHSFLRVSLFDLEGTLRASLDAEGGAPSDPSILGGNSADRDWYRGVTRGWKPYFSEVFSAASAPHAPVVAVALPIENDRGERVGILVGGYTLEHLTAIFESAHQQGDGYLLDQRGVVAASTQASVLGHPLPPAMEPLRRAALQGSNGPSRLEDGKASLFVGYAPVGDMGWTMLHALPEAETMMPATLLRRFGALAAGLLTLLFVLTMGVALSLVWKQGVLLATNRLLNQSLQAAHDKLEERVRARTRELQASERRLRTLIDAEPECVKLLSPEGTLLDINLAGLAILEAENLNAVRGCSVYPLVLPEFREAFRGVVREVCQGATSMFDFEMQGLKGTRRWMETYAVPFQMEDGQTVALCITRDVTARKSVEEALRESERQYRLLFEGNPHPVWIFDRESLAFLAVNDAAIRHYGYSREEFLCMTIKDIQSPEEVPRLLVDLATGKNQPNTPQVWIHRKKDGSSAEVEVSTHQLLWQGHRAELALALDVTERRSLEKQLHQAQKMEALGLLAGGVAHDFNNLLGVILGYCELLLETPVLPETTQNQLRESQQAGERAALLTRQLLAFSRRQIIEPVVLDLNGLLRDMSKMLRRLIGEDIELVTVLAPDLGCVKADPGQIEQVIMNLVLNARDAMPRGGRLMIETENVELDGEYVHKHVATAPGSHVRLVVSDTGVGMDEATQSHIFEPFFSTKEAGKGSGLGLATVYGIVKQSGGSIWLYSELGCGTTFKICLPRVSAPLSVPRTPLAVAASGGHETLLVVEDAEPLRKLTCEFLASRGYDVLEARDGAEALALAARHSAEIHLLVADVVMPQMNGRELANQLTARREGVKVLYMSGYTGDAVFRLGILENATAFLQKPFTLHGLACKVRELLDGT